MCASNARGTIRRLHGRVRQGGIRHGESHAILGENESVCHKKASEPNADLIPVKRENVPNRQISGSANEPLTLGKVASGCWAHAASRAEQISVNLGKFTMRTRPNELTISRGSGRKKRLQKLGSG